MRRLFGFNTTSLDQLAAWGLSHPEEHQRIIESLESLRRSSDPVLLRAVRFLMAPGVWSEFDVVYARLGCGGVFGNLPAPCERCGLTMVAMKEHVADTWVEVDEVLEDEGGQVEREPVPAVVVPEKCETVETKPEPVPEEAVAVARDTLAQKWQECEAVLERVRFERLKVGAPGDARLASRGLRRGREGDAVSTWALRAGVVGFFLLFLVPLYPGIGKPLVGALLCLGGPLLCVLFVLIIAGVFEPWGRLKRRRRNGGEMAAEGGAVRNVLDSAE